MKSNIFLQASMAIIISLFIASCSNTADNQQESQENFNAKDIPSVFTNLKVDEAGKLYYEDTLNKRNYLLNPKAEYSVEDFQDIEYGNPEGILLKFKRNIEGKVLYGFFPRENSAFPMPIFCKNIVEIKNDSALLNISMLKGKYDITKWGKYAYGRLRYRILTQDNRVITNKDINFKGLGPFTVANSIVLGPIISNLTPNSAVIRLDLNQEEEISIEVNGKRYSDGKNARHHEIVIDNLEAAKTYNYTIHLDPFSETHSFTTALPAGSKEEFTFAFASDSRGGLDVGESNTYGTNAYVMQKLAAFLSKEKPAFWQFTGDMISGYGNHVGSQMLEYTNWYRSISDFVYSIPIQIGMGNHEAFLHRFSPEYKYSVDQFPFEAHSAETLFSKMNTNPVNGPISEDGSIYDPNKDKKDFPTYKENVYSYTYGNIAMIVLNSNYLYTPRKEDIPLMGGNPHGYVMDQQLKWFENEMKKYEQSASIDHIFVSIHTPAFPNGGHANNDMWYLGNNAIRPYVAGKAYQKGIIERRDQLLDIMVNKSKKFKVLLTGDEHNYSRITIDNNTEIYPKDWTGDRLKFSRPFMQIVDGSAGAPYYGLEELPWTPKVDKFSSQYAVVLFTIKGPEVWIKVVNPETFETIEETQLY